jgi:hypothetical protein
MISLMMIWLPRASMEPLARSVLVMFKLLLRRCTSNAHTHTQARGVRKDVGSERCERGWQRTLTRAGRTDFMVGERHMSKTSLKRMR